MQATCNSMHDVCLKFPVTNDEYTELCDKFESLAHFQAWQLLRINVRNNCSDEQEDIVQDLRIAMLKAGSYFKRQTYIEECLNVLRVCVEVECLTLGQEVPAENRRSSDFIMKIVEELERLWDDRKRHGASRQKFGEFQEQILERLVRKHVPKDMRPDRNKPLQFSKEFKAYCKSITWNELKLKGKKITREKFWRTGVISLSEFDYMGST